MTTTTTSYLLKSSANNNRIPYMAFGLPLHPSRRFKANKNRKSIFTLTPAYDLIRFAPSSTICDFFCRGHPCSEYQHLFCLSCFGSRDMHWAWHMHFFPQQPLSLVGYCREVGELLASSFDVFATEYVCAYGTGGRLSCMYELLFLRQRGSIGLCSRRGGAKILTYCVWMGGGHG